MKLLFFILLGIILNVNIVSANISYAPNMAVSVEHTPPVEKQKVKKEAKPRNKKKKHPEHIQANPRMIWSLILGFILVGIALFFMIAAAILLFGGLNIIASYYVFYLGLFFLALGLPFVIVGFVRAKNRGVREKSGTTNEGKATY